MGKPFLPMVAVGLNSAATQTVDIRLMLVVKS